MPLWRASRVELVVAIAAAAAIPFYFGYIHLNVGELFVYMLGAAAAMTAGEWIETPPGSRRNLPLFFIDCAAWILVIGITGSMAYLAALLF